MSIALAAGPFVSRPAPASASASPQAPWGSYPWGLDTNSLCLKPGQGFFFGRQERAPEAPKSGAKVTPTDVGDEETAESPPSVEERPMEDNIEAPRPERWVQWLVGFHVAEEKKKKEEEGRGQEER